MTPDPDDSMLDAVRKAGWVPAPEEAVRDDERMTPAEFRVIREFLGLTGDWLAGVLGVQGRSVRRWEAGAVPIPDGVRIAVEQLEAAAEQAIVDAVAQLAAAEEPAVFTYRSDAHYQAHHPEVPYPASWHRALVARVALEVPGLAIAYAPDL